MLTSFSVAPLRLASLLGMVLAVIAFVFGLEIVYETLVYGTKVPGYPSLIVGVMVLGGVQLIMIGVIGEYIGKILVRDQRPAGLFRRRARREARSETQPAEPAAPSARTAAE